MFSAVYVEESLRRHERVQRILSRLGSLPIIACEHYGEIFNRSGQDFRQQKQAPALILAAKQGRSVLEAPPGYGFGEGASYYFSHMLNCLYDCRYCFLQGMYRSAHYLLFVNYEDFAAGIDEALDAAARPAVFYSGYDCDSLALEPVSGFAEYFLPLFRERPDATLELRTKSTQIRSLLDTPAFSNCIVAMSFSPEAAGRRWEHRVPALDKRLQALRKLQQAGWAVALRFEPVIAEDNCLEDYGELFRKVFSMVDAARLHSVSIGDFRMPSQFHKRIMQLYPEESLFARETVSTDGVMSLAGQSSTLLAQLESELMKYVDNAQYYRCAASG